MTNLNIYEDWSQFPNYSTDPRFQHRTQIFWEQNYDTKCRLILFFFIMHFFSSATQTLIREPPQAIGYIKKDVNCFSLPTYFSSLLLLYSFFFLWKQKSVWLEVPTRVQSIFFILFTNARLLIISIKISIFDKIFQFSSSRKKNWVLRSRLGNMKYKK